MTDREIVDWIESQNSGRGWNVAPRSEGWPLQIVTRGPFATFRQAVMHAVDRDADAKADREGTQIEHSVAKDGGGQ